MSSGNGWNRRVPGARGLASAAAAALLCCSCGDDVTSASEGDSDTASSSDTGDATTVSTGTSGASLTSAGPTSSDSDSASGTTADETTAGPGTSDPSTSGPGTSGSDTDPVETTGTPGTSTGAPTTGAGTSTGTDSDSESGTSGTTGEPIEPCLDPVEEDGGAVHFGGPSTEYALGFAVDSLGARYTGGYFFGDINLDPDGGAPFSQVGSGGNMWLNKIDAAGALEWAYTWPGIDGYHSYVRAIQLDAQGDVYVIGHFVGSVDFDPGPGQDIHVASQNNGQLDGFMWKLAPDGEYLWGRTWGGPEWLTAFDLAFGPDGDVYVTGYFGGTADLDPGAGQTMKTASGQGNGTDGYLIKLDPDGELLWAQTWGAGGTIYSFNVAVDDAGDAVVSGTIEFEVDLDPGPDQQLYASGGAGDSFVQRFASDGTWLWGHGFGAEGWDLTNDLAINSEGQIVLIGGFTSANVDLDPGPGSAILTNAGSYDGFVSRFHEDGTLAGTYHFASNGHDNLWGVAFDCDDSLVIAGHHNGTIDLDPGDGVAQHTSSGNADAFVVRLDADGVYQWSSSWGGPDYDQAGGLVIDDDRMIEIVGRFQGTADLAPGNDVLDVVSGGSGDVYFSRLRPSTGLW